MCPYRCRLCEAEGVNERHPGKKRMVFPDMRSLYMHVLKTLGPEHTYFRRKLGLPSRNHEVKLNMFRKAIEKEKSLWYQPTRDPGR